MESKLIITKPFFTLKSHCGYCDGNHSSSFGFEAEQTTPEHYDQLINIGFRRSGEYIYKPELISNCCHYFTIRTKYDLYKHDHGKSREMRKIVNKFNKFIGNEPNTSREFDFNKELDKVLKGNNRLRLEFSTNKFSKKKFELFKKYQVEIHHDKEEELKEKSFKRFLCSDPFGSNASIIIDEKNQYELLDYGALHMDYFLDDVLIAIGVLDVLPSGVSSVYFLYDPDFKDIQPGKLSTLLELRLTELLKLEYYYLGFYIPNITKMKYKKVYGGELLDQVLNKWIPFKEEEQVLKRLEDKIKEDKRDEVELKELEQNPFQFPKKFIGDFDNRSDNSIDYKQIFLFDLTNGSFKNATKETKEANQLKRVIGKLVEECIIKVW